MTPDQLFDSTMDPENRTLQQVTIDDASVADQILSMLIGDSVQTRRDFVFSSGRRHTRYWRDWSSDVCSSDLAPRGGGGGLQRGLVALAGVALLHLAADVEHRVVDADRQADEQDHGADLLLEREDLADRAEQADRRHHRGEAEQQRQAGGHERAEGEDEDGQRDWDRQ